MATVRAFVPPLAPLLTLGFRPYGDQNTGVGHVPCHCQESGNAVLRKIARVYAAARRTC